MKPFIRQKPFFGPRSRLKKSASEAGFLPVDYLDQISCFETLRAYRGRIFLLDQHCRRLLESSRVIGRSVPVSPAEIRYWLGAALSESGFDDALLRVMVYWKSNLQGLLAVLIRPFHSHPKTLYEKGVSVKTTSIRRWPLRSQDPQIKASQFMNGVLAALEKTDAPVYEWIFFGTEERVAEGSVSNLFLVDSRKRILTPCLGSGILKGVTRGVVIDLARQKGLGVTETFLTRHDFYTAWECFLTNTSSEVMPVVEMDGRMIGDGKPGVVTKMLLKRFRESVAAVDEN